MARLREKEREIVRLEEVIEKRRDLSFVTQLDEGQGVSKEQFVLALLVHFGIVDKQRDVQPWIEKFESMDARGIGRLYQQVGLVYVYCRMLRAYLHIYECIYYVCVCMCICMC
ncbi:hypothetical protein EON65_05365 [archaeon]|nr:MAG: hypothetical protein EON65_05365 [archaeon]